MARTADTRRREELLDVLVTDFAARGVGARSLREIAQAVGTSHRMLLHHFGSRDGLLIAVVNEVERRQMAMLRELSSGNPHGFTAMWTHLSRPELRALERLFFECYARAAQGEKPFATLLPEAVDDWLAVADADHTDARLGLAVTRGLLLDLVGTDDDAGVGAAAQRFADLIELRRSGGDT